MTPSDNAVAFDADVDPREEEHNRKRAEQIVKKAIRASGLPLHDKGVAGRFMPGLWATTIGVLLTCLDAEDAMALLSDRAAKIVPGGSNAASPPIIMTDRQTAKYVEDVTLAAKTISDFVNESIPTLEAEGLDDRLPETMLDCAIFVLLKGWGESHVKRAITEQIAAILTGHVAPAVFMEPIEMVVSQSEQETPEPKEQEPVGFVPSVSIEDASLWPRKKDIRVFFDHTTSGKTRKWAAAIEKIAEGDGTVGEIHLMSGNVSDANGRSTPIAAVVEILRTLRFENPESKTIIETPLEYSVKGMAGDPQTRIVLRNEADSDLWELFDRLTERRDIIFRTVSESASDTLQNLCQTSMSHDLAKSLRDII